MQWATSCFMLLQHKYREIYTRPLIYKHIFIFSRFKVWLVFLFQGVPSLHFTSISKDDVCEIELLGCNEQVGSVIRKISCMVLAI